MIKRNITDYSSYKTAIIHKLSLIYVVVSMFACFIYSTTFILIDAKLAAFVQLVAGIVFMIIAGLIKRKVYNITRHLAILTSMGTVVYQSIFMFGKSYGFHYQLFALLVVVFLLFDQKNKLDIISIFSFTTLIITIFFVCELANTELLYYTNTSYAKIYYLIATLFTFIGLAIVLHYFSFEIFVTKDQLYNLATTDELTGLYNRRTFKNHGDKVFKTAQLGGDNFSVIIFDIDSFKTVNDEYGHIVGDFVLSQMANRTKEIMRSTDFLSRYGGEEFGIILENTSSEQTLAVAEKLRKHIEDYIMTVDTHKIRRTISIGISRFRYDVVSFDDLVDEADKAMYQSKANGKNTITVFGANTSFCNNNEMCYKSME